LWFIFTDFPYLCCFFFGSGVGGIFCGITLISSRGAVCTLFSEAKAASSALASPSFLTVSITLLCSVLSDV
jgi:hypothetical protein